MDIYHLPERRVVYNYRYFLPYYPEWGDETFCRQRLSELLDFCRTASVDAVQFYVNTLPGTYYMPAHSAEEQETWAGWMREEVAPAIRAAGVSYQLNYQMLLGATSYGLDMRGDYDWEFLVNQHGQETLGCACPIGPVFREKMGAMLRLWAGTEPDIIWIDDDFRLHNHGFVDGGLDYYCYCPLHLEKFSEYAGRRYEREELLTEVLRPGKPSPLRGKWLDFLGATMTDTADWIRKEVQEESPFTRLALMTSSPDVHSVEGRNWRSVLTAMCGEYTPMTRPCSGVYSGTDFSVRKHTATFRTMAQSMTVLDDIFGRGGVEYGPELENTRFTTWSKSAANTRHAIMLGQLLGCRQITLSVNDLEGSPIDEEPSITPLLKKLRPVLQAVADADPGSRRPEGVVFVSDPDIARKIHTLQGRSYSELTLRGDWEDILLQCGLPARYASPEDASSSEDVVVLDRASVWSFSDEQLRRLLSGAVLLDGGAADALQERGMGEYSGVSVGPLQDFGAMAERYNDNLLPGVYACRIPHRGLVWHKLDACGASVASSFIDARGRCHIGSTIYENSLGGRIAVYAGVGDISPRGVFGSHGRLRWLHGVLRWLSRERFSVLPVIPHHGLTIVRSRGEEMLVAFANLGTDTLEEMIFHIPAARPWAGVKYLHEDGSWQQAEYSCRAGDAGLQELKVACSLNVFDWLVLLLHTES